MEAHTEMWHRGVGFRNLTLHFSDRTLPLSKKEVLNEMEFFKVLVKCGKRSRHEIGQAEPSEWQNMDLKKQHKLTGCE